RDLRIEYPARGLDSPAFELDRAGLEYGAAEVSLDQPHAAFGLERIGGRAQNGVVSRWPRVAPAECVSVEPGLFRISAHVIAKNGHDVAVNQPGVEELAHHETEAAGILEEVHV